MSRNNNLRPLMPEKGLSITDMGEYYDALDYVLRSQDIHNVALSGSYGSGKSSVLGSYENRHHEKKFMHVTLARFDEPYTEVDEKGTVINAAANKSSGDQKGNMCDNRGDRIVNILEEKILNQVLHQIQPKNIPLSAFRIKAPASRKRVYSLCAYGVCFTCLLLYHLYFELWSNIVWNLAPGWFTSLLMDHQTWFSGDLSNGLCGCDSSWSVDFAACTTEEKQSSKGFQKDRRKRDSRH